MTGPRVEPAEILEWRCACAIRPLLGFYTRLGGVHLKVFNRQRRPLHYVCDLERGTLKAHCPACHAWRELYAEHATIRERAHAGPRPAVACPDCRSVEPVAAAVPAGQCQSGDDDAG